MQLPAYTVSLCLPKFYPVACEFQVCIYDLTDIKRSFWSWKCNRTRESIGRLKRWVEDCRYLDGLSSATHACVHSGFCVNIQHSLATVFVLMRCVFLWDCFVVVVAFFWGGGGPGFRDDLFQFVKLFKEVFSLPIQKCVLVMCASCAQMSSWPV